MRTHSKEVLTKSILFLVCLGVYIEASSQMPITANAFLETAFSKTEVKTGECTIVNFAFYVYDDNKMPIHFYKLGEQLSPIIKALSPNSSYVVNSNIEEVRSTPSTIDGKGVYTYDIYRGAVCPTKPGDLTVPVVTLKMLHLLPPDRTDSVIVEYKTKPIKLHVTGEPRQAVGKFDLDEAKLVNEVSQGTVFNYKMLIDGKGFSFPLFPKSINTEKFDVNLTGSIVKDFLDADEVLANKEIKFEIIPKKGTEGIFKMSEIFGSIPYYDIDSNTVSELTPEKSITVTSNLGDISNKLPSDSVRTTLFVVDVSTSMLIEDLKPYRLGFIKSELESLISKGSNVEVIVFSGYARPLSTRNKLMRISDINVDMIDKKGTAMGDAVVFAIDHAGISGRNYSKNIIIAGDGDVTAGSINAVMAADYALSKGYTINAIGIGTFGPAEFGTDSEGKKYKVENTFEEKDFKIMTSKTKGRYVRATNKTELENFLKEVLKKP